MKNSITPWVKISVVKYAWVLCLGSVSISGCELNSTPPDDTQKTFVLSETMLDRIQLDTVKLSKVSGILNLNGKILADESRLVEIFPIVGGNVLSVNAELGDYVTKKQTLGIIRSGEVAEFDRQLIDAQSDVLVAQKNVNVKRDLFDSKLTSERELMTARNDLRKAEAALRRIEETFAIYGFNDKAEYHLKAPISGFIIHKNINRDMTLPSGHMESVFTIAELSEVWAVANVYESDISRIREGMEVAVSTLSYPGEYIKGKIDRVLNVLDRETKTMKIRIRIENADFKLKPEMLATVQVLYHEDKTLACVPSSAVIFDNSRHFVMVFKSRYDIETREVEVYRSSDNMTWITSGIEPGEITISKNQLFIYDALND